MILCFRGWIVMLLVMLVRKFLFFLFFFFSSLLFLLFLLGWKFCLFVSRVVIFLTLSVERKEELSRVNALEDRKKY